jgi:nucleoid DNA-binding protein
MEKMTILEIAKVLSERSGLAAKEASQFVTVMFAVVKEALENEQLVKVKGLGTFKIIDVDARESVNVNTGERVVIESHGKITFTPDAAMKEIVNKPFSQFETVVLNDGVAFGDLGDELPAEEETDVLEEVAEEASDSVNSESSVSNESVSDVSETIEDSIPVPDEKLVADENLAERLGEQSDVPTVEIESQSDSGQEQEYKNEESASEVEIEETVSAEETVSTVENEEIIPVVEAEEPLPITEVEDTVPETVEIQVEAEESESEEEPAERSTAVKWTFFSFLSLVLICLAGYGGFYFGYKKGSLDAASSPQLAVKSKKTEPSVPQSDTLKKGVAIISPATTEKPVAQVEEVKETEKAPSTKPEATPVKAVQTATKADANTDEYSKYDQMDNRVRTGAYRIVGTDHVVTVKAGETLVGITRRTLGEGMACYIEVYNGLPINAELKEGQKIKIPKVELKKKKRSN